MRNNYFWWKRSFGTKHKKLQNATSSSSGADIATSQLEVQPFIALCSRRSKVVFWFWAFELVPSVFEKSLSTAQSLMERNIVAFSVCRFVFSFQLQLWLLFFCSINFWLFGRRNLVVGHLDLLLHETQRFLIQQSKLSKQTETTQTKIILSGIRTRHLWIRSPARYTLRYEDFWNEWVLIGKSEWYQDEGTLHLLFFFILINSDR